MPTARLTFRRAQRLSLARDFQRVYAARTSVTKGPLRIHAMPNGLTVARLGLSVPGRIGTNVKRNRIKRILREAFRLHQRELPRGLDYVIAVTAAHEPDLTEYAAALTTAADSLAKTWHKRGALP